MFDSEEFGEGGVGGAELEAGRVGQFYEAVEKSADATWEAIKRGERRLERHLGGPTLPYFDMGPLPHRPTGMASGSGVSPAVRAAAGLSIARQIGPDKLIAAVTAAAPFVPPAAVVLGTAALAKRVLDATANDPALTPAARARAVQDLREVQRFAKFNCR